MYLFIGNHALPRVPWGHSAIERRRGRRRRHFSNSNLLLLSATTASKDCIQDRNDNNSNQNPKQDPPPAGHICSSKGLTWVLKTSIPIFNQVSFHGNKSRTCLGTLVCTRIVLDQSNLFNATLTKFLH